MILLDDKVVCPTSFPDGTLALRVDVSSKNNRKVIEWNYESDTEMVVLYYITKHLKNAGFSVSLFMPYIPNARMDRVKNGDEIFTLKYFAEFINSLGFETVHVRDPHSNVSCALFNSLKVDDGFKYIMQCLEEFNGNDTAFKPYTRDTYGIAVKATYAEDKDGNPIMIFKNPKTDTGKFKKSQRGCCTVHFDGEKFSYTDGLTFAEHDADILNIMQPVFRNSKMLIDYSLKDVRKNLWNDKF